jgi:hypothetical protein
VTNKTLTMLAVGDLMLGEKLPESFFSLVEPVLKTADVLVGQGEMPFTTRSVDKYYVEVPTEIFAWPACDPAKIGSLADAGFDVITLAGNHMWDAGVPGIEDTIAGLQKYGIAYTGAGMNIYEATRPAIIERDGTRFGFLDYNCVGPKLGWATPDKPGCAYVHIVVAYELETPCPGCTPTIYTFAEPRSLGAMVDDIQKLRPLCDVLVVCFHKGIGFVAAKVAMYEQQVSYAAIDAGADLILADHAHMLRGVEFYKGRPIFHGISNFVLGMPAPTEVKVPTRTGEQAWAVTNFLSKQKDIMGPYVWGEPSSDEGSLFHPETMLTIIAKCTIDGGKISRVGYIPCFTHEQGHPEVFKNDERGQQVFDYMDKITKAAGLNARYEWEGDEVVIHAE